MTKPLAIDLFCGLGGWTEGLLAEGYDVVGFDIEQHVYGEDRYPGMLAIQDVLTLHGSQFKNAALIVASPPCQEYSYMAMPWTRAKQIAKALRGNGDFPEGYKGSRTPAQLTALFDACFRLQQEASDAARRRIPLVVENVRGAEPWVGKAPWHYGSFYLWGDVPALMPMTVPNAKVGGHPGLEWSKYGTPGYVGRGFNEIARERAIEGQKSNPDRINGVRAPDGSWFPHHLEHSGRKNPGFRFDGSGKSFQSESVNRGVKQPGLSGARSNGKGDGWFENGAAKHGSKSSARKAASARIAKIPLALAQHIAHVYHPARAAA